MGHPAFVAGGAKTTEGVGESRVRGKALSAHQKEGAAIQVMDRRPHYNYQSFRVSCRVCPHLRERLWPWPQPRSYMRRLWLFRSTSYPGSDRPWWTCLTRPDQDHHQEPELSTLVLLSWSWVKERQGQQGQRAAAAGAAGADAAGAAGAAAAEAYQVFTPLWPRHAPLLLAPVQ